MNSRYDVKRDPHNGGSVSGLVSGGDVVTRATLAHNRPRLYVLVVRDDTGAVNRLIALVSLLIIVLYANRLLIAETAKAIISIADFINAVLDSCQMVYEATVNTFASPWPVIIGVG